MQPLAAHATPSALHQRLLRAVCHRLDSVTAQGCTLALALLSARPEYNAKFSVGERVKAAPRHQLQHAGAPVNCRAEDTGSRVFGAASAKALLPLAPAHLLPPANAPPRSEPHGACRVHRWALSPGLVVCTLQAVACGRNASAAQHARDQHINATPLSSAQTSWPPPSCALGRRCRSTRRACPPVRCAVHRASAHPRGSQSSWCPLTRGGPQGGGGGDKGARGACRVSGPNKVTHAAAPGRTPLAPQRTIHRARNHMLLSPPPDPDQPERPGVCPHAPDGAACAAPLPVRARKCARVGPLAWHRNRASRQLRAWTGPSPWAAACNPAQHHAMCAGRPADTSVWHPGPLPHGTQGSRIPPRPGHTPSTSCASR